MIHSKQNNPIAVYSIGDFHCWLDQNVKRAWSRREQNASMHGTYVLIVCMVGRLILQMDPENYPETPLQVTYKSL